MGMEYKKRVMKPITNEPITVTEHECEAASNCYLMSLVVLIIGVPLPIINLIATLIFYFNKQNATYFVRWHCLQALLSQITLFIVNVIGLWWTIAMVNHYAAFSIVYMAYISFAVLCNVVEFIMTIYTAIEVRKGISIEWWLYRRLINKICNSKTNHLC